MYKLITLLKQIAVPLLFVLAEVLAILHYANSTAYNKAQILSATNSAVGAVSGVFGSVGDYFRLASENEALRDEVESLRNQLEDLVADSTLVSSYSAEGEIVPYYFSSAKVLQNSVIRQRNYFIIDKGLRDGVQANMAVLSMQGEAAGYVVTCSEKFSVCMSVANLDFTMGGKGLHNEFMGSITWNGDNYRMVMLENIPHYANFAKGDTIISTISYRFPPDRIIGIVEEFKSSEDKMNSYLKVRLAADLAKLDRVLLVKFVGGDEFRDLHRQYDESSTEK